MLSCISSNKLTKGKNQRVPQNLDNPRNGQTLEWDWALGHLPYLCLLTPVDLGIKFQCKLYIISCLIEIKLFQINLVSWVGYLAS